MHGTAVKKKNKRTKYCPANHKVTTR
jgi:hypothetical protein